MIEKFPAIGFSASRNGTPSKIWAGDGEIASAEQGADQAPGQTRLVLHGVETSFAHLPGGEPGSGDEPEGGKDPVQGEADRAQVPDRDRRVADDGEHGGRVTTFRGQSEVATPADGWLRHPR